MSEQFFIQNKNECTFLCLTYSCEAIKCLSQYLLIEPLKTNNTSASIDVQRKHMLLFEYNKRRYEKRIENNLFSESYL